MGVWRVGNDLTEEYYRTNLLTQSYAQTRENIWWINLNFYGFQTLNTKLKYGVLWKDKLLHSDVSTAASIISGTLIPCKNSQIQLLFQNNLQQHKL